MTGQTQQEFQRGWDPHISDYHPDAQAAIEAYAQRIIFLTNRSAIRKELRRAYATAHASALSFMDDCTLDDAHAYASAFVVVLGKRLGELKRQVRPN